MGHILWSLGKHSPKLFSGGPVYLRSVVEDLDGGIIKLAQILALRYDLLPTRYCEELLHLFDRVAPLASSEVRLVFREEFSKAPEEIFEEFSYVPHATASFGQVHRATLSGGYSVAVKVQKPGLRPRIAADIALAKFVVRIANWLWAGAPL